MDFLGLSKSLEANTSPKLVTNYPRPTTASKLYLDETRVSHRGLANLIGHLCRIFPTTKPYKHLKTLGKTSAVPDLGIYLRVDSLLFRRRMR